MILKLHSIIRYFSSLERWGLVLGLLDDLVDLTLEEQVDAITDRWAQWVSSTRVEHVKDDLDVLVEITSILHTRVSCVALSLGELALLVLTAKSLLGKTEETSTHFAGLTAAVVVSTVDGGVDGFLQGDSLTGVVVGGRWTASGLSGGGGLLLSSGGGFLLSGGGGLLLSSGGGLLLSGGGGLLLSSGGSLLLSSGGGLLLGGGSWLLSRSGGSSLLLSCGGRGGSCSGSG